MVKDRVFLLGGMDLEMCTIRDILEEGGHDYIDKHLHWGNALLSEYKDEVMKYDSNTQIVGIELCEDISLPSNYLSIDHHNELSGRVSSLEQVVNLLELKMNRFQMLVAANDKGYIDGMKDLGATEEDIRRIRQLDRQCQGVTELEEAEADKLVANVSGTDKWPVMIETRLNHFSPVSDRLYPVREYVIYNDHEMVYFGCERMKETKAEFAAELKERKAYYGGSSSNQFFGVTYNEKQMDEYKQKMEGLLGL